MIRGLFSQLWILSIAFCPLYCGAMAETATIASCCQRPDDACAYSHTHADGQHLPPPCTDGCERDCVCKGLLDDHEKHGVTLTDLCALPAPQLDAFQLSIVRPATNLLSPSELRPQSAVHPDLFSGVAIPLAIASLLI